MRFSLVLLLALASGLAMAQESQLGADFRGERERIARDCGSFNLKTLTGCGVTLFTDHPMHIAVGSIAPQNGVGLGLALVTHYTPGENWRLSWNFDGIASTNASWRAGGYMKIIHTPRQSITPVINSGTAPAKSSLSVHEYTVFNLYAQGISLNKLFYFGEGPNSLEAGRSTFAQQQTIVGGSAIVPLNKLGIGLYGEMNGRFVNIDNVLGQGSPSISQLYNNVSAPGLATQPGFLQFGEGVRLKQVLFNDHLQLNYSFIFQQFTAPSNSTYSFRRWTADFGHSFPLYGKSRPGPKEFNGPDQCAAGVTTECPKPAYSRNREGAIGFRLLMTQSIANAGSTVPFYFQPTIGGSDINGNPYLPAFQDYRFRAPNLLLLRESFEHSIWGPLGVDFMADQGKVALTRGNVDFSNLEHSYAAGLTIRAGGLPVVYFLFAWGGETQHNIASIDNSLLGGSVRPSLF